MARNMPLMRSARLWYCVFLLLSIAVIAAEAQPAAASRDHSRDLASELAMDLQPATSRGPLYHYVLDAARCLGSVSRAALGGSSPD